MKDETHNTSAFIIATRNRPGELVRSVRSICEQTMRPGEICIVDSSEEASARSEIEGMCDAAGIRLSYHHPAPRGLTIQRNYGIDRTTGDPVFLVDDDVYLAPDCHEQILAEYQRWGPELGGVRATGTEPARPPFISIVWRKLFGIGGWWPEASGRMRAGFFVEGISESSDVRRIEYMTGWFMSFRRAVFDLERFDEKLAGYGYKEDVDFTYRVARRGYVLLQTPRARCTHFHTVTDRLSSHQLMRSHLANQFYLHRKNMPQDLKHRAALWWGILGLFLLNVGRGVFKRDPGLVTGMIVGAWEQAKGAGLIDPAEAS